MVACFFGMQCGYHFMLEASNLVKICYNILYFIVGPGTILMSVILFVLRYASQPRCLMAATDHTFRPTAQPQEAAA